VVPLTPLLDDEDGDFGRPKPPPRGRASGSKRPPSRPSVKAVQSGPIDKPPGRSSRGAAIKSSQTVGVELQRRPSSGGGAGETRYLTTSEMEVDRRKGVTRARMDMHGMTEEGVKRTTELASYNALVQRNKGLLEKWHVKGKKFVEASAVQWEIKAARDATKAAIAAIVEEQRGAYRAIVQRNDEILGRWAAEGNAFEEAAEVAAACHATRAAVEGIAAELRFRVEDGPPVFDTE
jgi:hypothetical protein